MPFDTAATRTARPWDSFLRLEREGPSGQDAFDRIDITRTVCAAAASIASAPPTRIRVTRRARPPASTGWGPGSPSQGTLACARASTNAFDQSLPTKQRYTPICVSIPSVLRLAADTEDSSFSRRSARLGEPIPWMAGISSGPPELTRPRMPRRRKRGSPHAMRRPLRPTETACQTSCVNTPPFRDPGHLLPPEEPPRRRARCPHVATWRHARRAFVDRSSPELAD